MTNIPMPDLERLARVVGELEEVVNDMPCRVSAETRSHLAKQAQNDQFVRKLDPWDDALMHDLFGKNLAAPLATLLIALDQIERTQESFGADADKTVAFVVPKIAALRDACLKVYEEDQ